MQGKHTTATFRLSYMTFHYLGRDLILQFAVSFGAWWFFLWLWFPLTFWLRLHIPPHMLPQTRHPTTLSLLHSENHTVVNVLVDMVSSLVSSAHLCDLSCNVVDLPNFTCTYFWLLNYAYFSREVLKGKFLLKIMRRERKLHLTRGSPIWRRCTLWMGIRCKRQMHILFLYTFNFQIYNWLRNFCFAFESHNLCTVSYLRM